MVTGQYVPAFSAPPPPLIRHHPGKRGTTCPTVSIQPHVPPIVREQTVPNDLESTIVAVPIVSSQKEAEPGGFTVSLIPNVCSAHPRIQYLDQAIPIC